MDRREFLRLALPLAAAAGLPRIACASRCPPARGFVVEADGSRVVGAGYGQATAGPVSPTLKTLLGRRYREADERDRRQAAAGALMVFAAADPNDRTSWRRAAAFCAEARQDGAKIAVLYAEGVATLARLRQVAATLPPHSHCCIYGHDGYDSDRLAVLACLHHGMAPFPETSSLAAFDLADVVTMTQYGGMGFLAQAAAHDADRVAARIEATLAQWRIGPQDIAFCNAWLAAGENPSTQAVGRVLDTLRSPGADSCLIFQLQDFGVKARLPALSAHILLAPLPPSLPDDGQSHPGRLAHVR